MKSCLLPALIFGTLLTTGGSSTATRTKTLRVDHGQPLVVVSEKSVAVLELIKEPIGQALVPTSSPEIRHCRARYRFKWFEPAANALHDGEGTVEEIVKTLSRSTTGAMVDTAGSRTSIGMGDIHAWWSEANAGSRSWIYYQAGSGIRFVQQLKQLAYDQVTVDSCKQFLNSRNLQDFIGAGRTLQVMGPAVFSGDIPVQPVPGRIESFRLRDSAVEIKLSNLATNQPYLIESSYEAGGGNWNAVHKFVPKTEDYSWSDPLGKEVTVAFYRIRVGH